MSTSTPTQNTQAPEPLPSPAIYRMTVAQYEQMAKVLRDARVELIDGYSVNKTSKDPPHIWAVDAIRVALQRLFPGCWCRKEDPVRIPDFDEPEPDVAVVRGIRDDDQLRIPGPDDIKLVVEISDTTLGRDRGAKSAAYAKGLIPAYWIVNLVERQVEVDTLPAQAAMHPALTTSPARTSRSFSMALRSGQSLRRAFYQRREHRTHRKVRYLRTTSICRHQRTALHMSRWYMGCTSASSVWPLARWQSRPRPGSRNQPAAAHLP